MANQNQVNITGYIGQDAEYKSFSNGGGVCNFSVAVSEKWRDKNAIKLRLWYRALILRLSYWAISQNHKISNHNNHKRGVRYHSNKPIKHHSNLTIKQVAVSRLMSQTTVSRSYRISGVSI